VRRGVELGCAWRTVVPKRARVKMWRGRACGAVVREFEATEPAGRKAGLSRGRGVC